MEKPHEDAEYRRLFIDGVRYYGKHLVATASHCDDRLLDTERIAEFLLGLVDRIDMTAYGPPVVARFGQGIEVGISGVQLIETSAIMVHTNDTARDMYLDVFSCKGFSEDVALAYLREAFAPESISSQILLRR